MTPASSRIALWLWLISGVFLGTALAHAQENSVGLVIATQGAVSALNQTGAERALQRKSPLFVGDTIKTGANAQAQLRFLDGEVISLRANSLLKVDDYKYQQDPKTDKTVLNLIQGGVRAVTGAIGKNNPDNYRMNTPVATIGIRGTIYEAVLGKQLFVAVWQGSITIQNEGGKIDLGVNAEYNYAEIPANNQAPKPLLEPPPELQQDKAPPMEEAAAEPASEPEQTKPTEQDGQQEEAAPRQPQQGEQRPPQDRSHHIGENETEQPHAPDGPRNSPPPGSEPRESRQIDLNEGHRGGFVNQGNKPPLDFGGFTEVNGPAPMMFAPPPEDAPFMLGGLVPQDAGREPLSPGEGEPLPLLPPPGAFNGDVWFGGAPPPSLPPITQIIGEQEIVNQIPITPKLSSEEGNLIDTDNRVGILVVVDPKTAEIFTGKSSAGSNGTPIFLDIARPNVNNHQSDYRSGPERSVLRQHDAGTDQPSPQDANVHSNINWGHWSASAETPWTRQIDTAEGTATNAMPVDAYWLTVIPTANPGVLQGTLNYSNTVLTSGQGSGGTVTHGKLEASINLNTGIIDNAELDVYVGVPIDDAGNPISSPGVGEHWHVVLVGTVRGHVVDFGINQADTNTKVTFADGATSGISGDVLGILVGQNAQSLAGAFTLHANTDPNQFVDGIFTSDCTNPLVCDKRLLDTEKTQISQRGGILVFNEPGNNSRHSGHVVTTDNQPVFLTHDPQFPLSNGIDTVYRIDNATPQTNTLQSGIDWGYWDTASGAITAQIAPLQPELLTQSNSDALWIAGTPTPDANLPKTGTISYNNTLIGEGFGSGGTVTALSLSADIDFLSGQIANGDLAITVEDGQANLQQWNADFSGQAAGNKIGLTVDNGTLDGNQAIVGDLDARLLGPTADLIGGGYHLETVADPNNYVNGIFVVKCEGCP
jgi:hypothetical protein